ncbi:nucleotidyltransferase family protein, partial [Myxococcota bacterium]|nr:nucleotidyltransferase family protein [Myxococcota bacterium]
MRLSPELGSITQLLSSAVGLPGPSLAVRARPVEWWRWVVLTDEHQLGPFLASRLVIGQAVPSGLPRVVEEELADRYARTGHEASFRDVELLRVLELFERGATPLVLKGSALVHTLYGEGAERPMSDVDLLFRDGYALADARERLVGAGYSCTRLVEPTPVGHHHAPPLVHPTRQQTLELHTNLATPGLPAPAIEALWRQRRTVPVGGLGRFQVLDPVSALLHHAVHAAADPIDAPLLRNLFEVAWMTSLLDRADRTRLRALVVEWGVERRVAPAFELAAALFGAPRVLPALRGDLRAAWCLRRLAWSVDAP